MAEFDNRRNFTVCERSCLVTHGGLVCSVVGLVCCRGRRRRLVFCQPFPGSLLWALVWCVSVNWMSVLERVTPKASRLPAFPRVRSRFPLVTARYSRRSPLDHSRFASRTRHTAAHGRAVRFRGAHCSRVATLPVRCSRRSRWSRLALFAPRCSRSPPWRALASVLERSESHERASREG